MAGEIQTFELIEPASPEALVPTYGLWPWFAAGGALLLLSVVVLLVVVFRKRKSEATSLLLQRIAAYSAANAALANIAATSSTRETAVLTSLILRRYLSTAANDPALFETHEEFISRQDSLQALTPQARAAAGDGFTRLAALKYAPELPAGQSADVIAESRALLETLHHGFTA